jgi:hypothetical protein
MEPSALKAELHERGFVLVADDAPKKKLVLKQYRRWQRQRARVQMAASTRGR